MQSAMITSHREYAEWPLERSELIAVSDFLLSRAPGIFSSPCGSGHFSGRCLLSLSSRLLQDILGFVAATTLSQRIKDPARLVDKGIAPAFLKAKVGGGSLCDLPTIKMLQDGLKDISTLRKMARTLKGLVIHDGFIRRPLVMADFDQDIISVSSQPLIWEALGVMDQRVHLTPIHGWFPKVERSRVEDIKRREDFTVVISVITELVYESVTCLGRKQSRAEIEVIEKYLKEALALVGAYILQLELGSRPLPRHLWAGSSGIVWIRMLQEAVLQKGGNTTGFDHAEGANFDEDCKFGFTELQTVKKFVTFNRYTASHFRRAATNYNFSGIVPDVEFLQFGKKRTQPDSVRLKGSRSITSLLFLPPFITGSEFGLYPALGPVQGVNFVNRVLSYTAELGIHVIFKPHPLMRFPLSEIASSWPHVELIKTERSEDLLSRANALLIDYPMQTTMGVALKRDVPIALLDTGQIRLSQKLRTAMSQRVGYVKILEDGAGDWRFERDHLKIALDAAISGASDTSFVEEFMTHN